MPFIIDAEAPGEKRRERRARHRALRERGVYRGRGRGAVKHIEVSFPTEGGTLGRGSVGGSRLHLPPVRVTTARYEAATPFLSDAGSGVLGPRIGRDVTGGGWFHFDPWRFYNRGWITGTSIVHVGRIGSGKSLTCKATVRRAISEGRHVAVASDAKGEWVRVAETVEGAQILRLGEDGHRINPLEPGVRPPGLSDREWASEVRTRRQQLLTVIVSIMREGRVMDDEEHEALDLALKDLDERPETPTIRSLIDRLNNPDSTVEVEVVQSGKSLARALRRAVSGDLAGMFDDHSTVEFEINTPMLVISTRSVLNKPANVRAVASACTSFWIDSVVRAQDSGYWYVISEEGWSEMRFSRSVELMDERQRLAGELGLAGWLLMHEINDLHQVGEPGSAQRNQALGLLSKSEIKIIQKQSESSIDMTIQALKLTDREAEKVLTLEQGHALWKIGDRALEVETLVTKPEWDVMNTSEFRGGK